MEERTLLEKLYRLQTFELRSLDLAAPFGNGFGAARWRITWIATPGGEQFLLTQVDFVGREGSGIYRMTCEGAAEAAQEIVRDFFRSEARAAARGFGEDCANDYDWREIPRFADAI